MEVRALGLPGVLELVPKRHGDGRGWFCETYNAARFAEAGMAMAFVQDNHSRSGQAGTLRGLHYQLEPHAQDKLVRVVRGAVLDVAVDIRRSSASFGRWVGLELSAAAGNQIFVPKGFAHGFVTLEADTEVVYKASAFYAPHAERAVRFDDPALGIAWPFGPDGLHLSAKDRAAPLLAKAELFE